MIAYTLQISNESPTQFKIQVVEIKLKIHDELIVDKRFPEIVDEIGWRMLGLYMTVDELEAALSPYLYMEQKT